MNYFNYFSEIEETFIRRRGRNLLLSPLDWALIETWQERGIPLRIVLRGIEKIFDAVDEQPKSRKTIKSLMYCREEIEARYADWLETQVGKNGTEKAQKEQLKSENSGKLEKFDAPKSDLFSGEAISAHLETVSASLRKARQKADGGLRETLETVLSSLAKLEKANQNVETLEKTLEKLDASIDESLKKNSETEALKIEIKKELVSYQGKMEREVFERTFDLMLLKRLRERAEIPRLSLFYL